MENYNQKIVALVLNVRKPVNIPVLQIELIEFLKKFDSDDKVYIYNNSGNSYSKSSKAVAELSRYDFEGSLPLYDLMRDAISALDFETGLDKILFIFNDSPFDPFQVSKMLRIAAKSECKLSFFEIGSPAEVESFRTVPGLHPPNLGKAAELEGFQIISTPAGLSETLYGLYKDGGI